MIAASPLMMGTAWVEDLEISAYALHLLGDGTELADFWWGNFHEISQNGLLWLKNEHHGHFYLVII